MIISRERKSFPANGKAEHKPCSAESSRMVAKRFPERRLLTLDLSSNRDKRMPLRQIFSTAELRLQVTTIF